MFGAPRPKQAPAKKAETTQQQGDDEGSSETAPPLASTEEVVAAASNNQEKEESVGVVEGPEEEEGKEEEEEEEGEGTGMSSSFSSEQHKIPSGQDGTLQTPLAKRRTRSAPDFSTPEVTGSFTPGSVFR